MKVKKYIIGFAAIALMSSCEDFLDTKNLYQKGLDNFYASPKDINEAMAGVYNALYVNGVHSEELLAANLMADEMLAGGGPDDITAKNVDRFADPTEDTYKDLWVETYNGLYRCNAIIEKMTITEYDRFFKTKEEAVFFKNQSLGEAYFMRAFLLFRAAKFFGGMPLIMTTATPRNLPRASFTQTFAQIMSDLKVAIETMPKQNAKEIPGDRYGHANRWIAESYMGRVFLYYTGYMTNIEKTPTNSIALNDGSTMDKTQVVTYLDDCINNSGYKLLDKYGNLWPYSYVNKGAGKTVLPWAETEGLAWAGQDGFTTRFGTGNSEVMFAQRFAYGNWDWNKGQSFNNRMCLYFGIRDNSLIPFGQGWGWGTVHPVFFGGWDNADKRKLCSVLEIGKVDQGTDQVERKGDETTGLVNKKYTTLQYSDPDNGKKGVKGMFYFLYNMSNNDPLQLWAAQDFYYMRFSDVLLMQSELTGTATNLNLVRRRAGLPDVAYSPEALKEERKHEFAFEGLRWFDLVRWGDVETAGKNYYSVAADVNNSGVDAKYTVKYRPETKGLVPVPESEIRLSNGVYQQNSGW